MAAINPEQKAVLELAHSYYRQSQGESYSFFMDQLSFNGINHAQPLVEELLNAGLLQKCGTRFRISEAGISAIEAEAINLLETNP
jgi:hypothetical protein